MSFFLTCLLPVLAAENAPAADNVANNQGQSLFDMLPFLAIMFLIFYVLIIRPQRKIQRQKQEMIMGLQKHDEIITRGGIIGTVIEVRQEKDEVLVEVAKGTRFRIRRPAIEAVINREGTEAKEEEPQNR